VSAEYGKAIAERAKKKDATKNDSEESQRERICKLVIQEASAGELTAEVKPKMGSVK